MNIIVAPINSKKLIQIRLPQPKNGQPQQFFYDEDNIALYESTKYSDQFRSWFMDDLFCKDGHLNLFTRIDPLYIFIPQLIKFANEQFRTLHDICSTFSSNNTHGSSRLDYALSPDIKWDQVCDIKELDNELFVRFSEKRTLEWLSAKHDKTMEALKQQLDAKTSKATLISYATDLIDLYLDPSLSDKFKSLVRSKSLLVTDDDPKATNSPSHNKSSKRPSTITQFFNTKK